jgi:hypothetical protein
MKIRMLLQKGFCFNVCRYDPLVSRKSAQSCPHARNLTMQIFTRHHIFTMIILDNLIINEAKEWVTIQKKPTVWKQDSSSSSEYKRNYWQKINHDDYERNVDYNLPSKLISVSNN